MPEIIALLKSGKDVALVSDAGTPGISDPGFPLIREALKEGMNVVPIPGPSALAAALSAAGLPTHRVLFAGFPPPKKEATRKLLASLKDEEATLVFYLPVRRIPEFLAAILETLGDRKAVIARELTKLHEEFIRGAASELLEAAGKRTFKGEATVLIHGARNPPQPSFCKGGRNQIPPNPPFAKGGGIKTPLAPLDKGGLGGFIIRQKESC